MSETTGKTRADDDDARIEELKQSVYHWHDTAQMLKRQRDMAEQERDEWKRKYLDKAGAHDKTRRAWGEEAADMTRNAMRDGSEFGSLLSEHDALRAERDALRKECNEALEMLSFTGETSLWQAAAAANQEVGYFRAERDALRKDAARYRYLRQGDGRLYITPGPDEGNSCGAVQGAVADQAIDAAMEAP